MTGTITGGPRHQRCPHCQQTIAIDATGVHTPQVVTIPIGAIELDNLDPFETLVERIFGKQDRRKVRALKLRDERATWRRR